jgi:high-affinity nickel-transport protein
MSRLVVGRFVGRIRASWQLYPLGVLFGLGFDTATEVGLLALSAGVATNHAPAPAVLSLPILFAAGMSLMDTADGAFMAHAYGWAFSTPVRKVYYNLTVTSLSVAVALGVGGIELLQVAARTTWLDFGTLGYGIVGLFVLTWVVSGVVWKTRRIEERWAVRTAGTDPFGV